MKKLKITGRFLPELKDKLKQRKTKKRKREAYGSELELLTTELIHETVGENGALEAAYRKLTAERKKDPDKPLTKEETEEIMMGLVKVAVAQRRLLAGRIEDSIEFGQLFDRYYGKLQTINTLTNCAYARLQRLQKAESDYLYEAEVFRKVRAKAYESGVSPDDSTAETQNAGSDRRGRESSAKRKTLHRMGIWEQMDYTRESTVEIEGECNGEDK